MGAETINRDKIILPEISFTDHALKQLGIIIENDFTLAGKYVRVLISGKGCDGFTYSIGFTDTDKDDFTIEITKNLQIIVDPFTAFYLGRTEIDYVEDYLNNNEGFVVKNMDQENFQGKFWRENKELIPPQVTK